MCRILEESEDWGRVTKVLMEIRKELEMVVF
jgi:hypothetical protein